MAATGRQVLRRELIGFALVALAMRAVFMVLDHQPRYFLGDSESYLFTGFGTWIPNDRSWIYGLLLNGLFRATHSLVSLLIVQGLLSAALCWGVAASCRLAGVRASFAWAALIVLSVDPMLLYYDRSIMTDAPGTVAVALGVLLTARTMAGGSRWSWLWAMICFWAAIGLRTALLPLVFWAPAFAFGHGVLRAWRSPRIERTARLRAFSSHLTGPVALLTGVTIGLLAYAAANGKLTRSRPSLNPRGGAMLIALVAPILATEDFAGLPVESPGDLLARSQHQDRLRRNCQLFCPDGLVLLIEAALESDWRKTSRYGSVLARRSILRDPLGFTSLAFAQAGEYLTLSSYRQGFDNAFGLDRELPDHMVQSLRTKVHDQVDRNSPARPSPGLGWLRLSLPWLPVLCWLALLLPAVALAMSRRLGPGPRTLMVLLATSTWAYAVPAWSLSLEVVPRYLLPLAPLVIALLALTVEALLRGRAELAPSPSGAVLTPPCPPG